MAAAVDTRSEYAGLFSLYLVVGLVVTAIVFGAVAFAVIRYRNRDPAQVSGRDEAHLLEGCLAALILAVVAVLLVRTFTTESRVDAAPHERVSVQVTAFRWGWRFTYPGQGVSVVGNSDRNPSFAVPVGREVHFSITSLDVIHSFWVPGERFKRDAFPGKQNHFDLSFDERGSEQGECAEFCGLRHSDMGFDVLVLSPSSYRRWLAAHRERPFTTGTKEAPE